MHAAKHSVMKYTEKSAMLRLTLPTAIRTIMALLPFGICALRTAHNTLPYHEARSRSLPSIGVTYRLHL